MNTETNLVAARNECLSHLINVLGPVLYKGINIIWQTSKVSDKPYVVFQKNLGMIPVWNQNVLDSEYKRITDEQDCDWIDKLVETILLLNIKIIATIRVSKKKDKLNIDIPNCKSFIHKCYIEVARNFWVEPHLFEDRAGKITAINAQKNTKLSLKIIENSIKNVIREASNLKEILTYYTDDIINSDEETSDKGSVIETKTADEASAGEAEEERPAALTSTFKPDNWNAYSNQEGKGFDPLESINREDPGLVMVNGDTVKEVVEGKDDEEVGTLPLMGNANAGEHDFRDNDSESERRELDDSDSDSDSDSERSERPGSEHGEEVKVIDLGLPGTSQAKVSERSELRSDRDDFFFS